MNGSYLMKVLDVLDDGDAQETVQALYGEEKTAVRHTKRKLGRTLLLAAVLISLLTVTAYAANAYLTSPEQAIKVAKRELQLWEELGIVKPQGAFPEENAVANKMDGEDLGGSFYHRILRPHYTVTLNHETGSVVCMVDTANGKIYHVSFEAKADEDDPIVGDGIEWDDGTAYVRDNVSDLVPEGQTLDELCQMLCDYWGFTGYRIGDTNYADYQYEDVHYEGDELVSALWQQPFATVYFEGDQDGVPMYIELSAFAYPGRSSTGLLIGTNHGVG